MGVPPEFEVLINKFESGKIHESNKLDLELYLTTLCYKHAVHYFPGQQYSQVCETVRLLLFKRYLEEIDRKNSLLQKLVVILAAFAVIGSMAQIYIALSTSSKPIGQIQQYTQPPVLKPISTQVRK